MGWSAGKKAKSIPVFEEHCEPHRTPAEVNNPSGTFLSLQRRNRIH